jgi:hypothetical protein
VVCSRNEVLKMNFSVIRYVRNDQRLFVVKLTVSADKAESYNRIRREYKRTSRHILMSSTPLEPLNLYVDLPVESDALCHCVF